MSEVAEGRYLYCIINSNSVVNLGDTGIEDSIVYTIPYSNIAAVVHSCPAKPYATEDKSKASEWILSHNYVIDCVMKKFGTVLPFSFDSIVRGNDDAIYDWLRKSHDRLKDEIERLKNKAEYSIQIFCGHEYLKTNIAASDPEFEKMKDDIDKMNKGAAYLYKRKFELKLKDVVSDEISRVSREFYSEIKDHVEEMREEKNMQNPIIYNGKNLILGLTCLVHEDKIEKLGELLDEINKREGFAVRFTGPWAPYSFVHKFDEAPVQKIEDVEHGS